MERGLNSPFLVLASENQNAEREAVVVKCLAGYANRRELMIRELFSLILARQLGLRTVEPIIINLQDGIEFGAMDYRNHGGQDYVQLISDSIGLNFGTIHLGSDWKQWLNSKPPKSIPKEEVNSAYTFDAIVQNSDRLSGNPNLLWRGNELVMLDFDKSFGYLKTHANRPKPWREVMPMMQLPQHCRFHHLERNAGNIEITGLWDRFEEWNLRYGSTHITQMIQNVLKSSSLDISGLSDYFSELSAELDDFFAYLIHLSHLRK